MIEKVIIIGGGGHARVIIDIIQCLNNYEVFGYTDSIDKGKILSANYLGKDDILFTFQEEIKNIVLGIGYIGNKPDCYYRKKIIDKFKNRSFNYPNIISNMVILGSSFSIGVGNVLFHRVIINPLSKIADFCVLNTAVIIEHHCEIGSYSQLGPGVVMCGESKIGSFCFVGANSTIVDRVQITDNVTIGAGSVVIKNITEPGVYVGNPARKIK